MRGTAVSPHLVLERREALLETIERCIRRGGILGGKLHGAEA
jgi:predicted TIM-barrel fold metal-dependent hydrolase